MFPGEASDRGPWGAGDNERERSVAFSTECWSKFTSSCCQDFRDKNTIERITVPEFASWFRCLGSTGQCRSQIRPFPNHHTCAGIQPALHSKSAEPQATVLPLSVQRGLYSSREHLTLGGGQEARQKPLCCCVNARHSKWPRVFGQISVPEMLYIVHKTPVSGKHMCKYRPNQACLDNNLFFLHFLWLCVGNSLRQQCSVTPPDFTFLKKASNILV